MTMIEPADLPIAGIAAPRLALAILFLALFLFWYIMSRRMELLKKGMPDFRFSDIGERIRLMLVYGLVLGKLPRLSGADMIVYPSPYGKFLFLRETHLRVAHQLRADLYGLKTTFPGPSGGVHAGNLTPLLRDLGPDRLIGVGGGIDGHPMGATAGARSVRQAIDAWLKGVPLNEAASSHPELKAALDAWGGA